METRRETGPGLTKDSDEALRRFEELDRVDTFLGDGDIGERLGKAQGERGEGRVS